MGVKCGSHINFTMAPIYLIIALIVQSSLIVADTEETEGTESEEILTKTPEVDDEVVKDFKTAKQDFFDMFLMPSNLYPSSSAAMMAQATNSDKPVEEQLEEIKEIAERITLAIQSEMANLLSYALSTSDKDVDENKLNRKRRSTENPIDSAQMVMRLLNHIKSSNEFQNIAIEKMMSAQEIADKFGIEFNPDPEILTDLAKAANEHAQDLSTMLNEACNMRNKTCENINFIPVQKEAVNEKDSDNNAYYVYAMHYPDDDGYVQQNILPSYEYISQQIPNTQSPVSQAYYNNYNYPYETQIQSPPLSKKPSFYDVVSGTPDYYPSYCPVDPTATVIAPFEDQDPEPELVAEEYEETMSNRVIVERGDEFGSATVNHVMTYSISEKSHFRSPEIEQLPQQMQYYFYLV